MCFVFFRRYTYCSRTCPTRTGIFSHPTCRNPRRLSYSQHMMLRCLATSHAETMDFLLPLRAPTKCEETWNILAVGSTSIFMRPDSRPSLICLNAPRTIQAG